MRDLKTLYEIVLKDSKKNRIQTGLCSKITILNWRGTLTDQERRTLENDLWEHSPLKKGDDSYWFPPGDQKPRLSFLRSRIKELNKQGEK